VSERGRESGQPIGHRGDENRFDVMIEARQDQGADQRERRAERNAPAPAQAKRAFAATRPSSA